MRCPRCQRASPDEAVFCRGCGAPLALRAEPAPRPLDLSISLDRRAGGRELSLDPPREASQGQAWDLRGRLGLAAVSPPSAAFEDGEDDEIRFGPVPELAPDHEPEPALAPGIARRRVEPELAPEPAFAAEPAFAPGSEPAFAAESAFASGPAVGEETAAYATEPAFASEPVDAPTPPRMLARALGLEPDPVVPDDLGFAAFTAATAEQLEDPAPGAAPHARTDRAAPRPASARERHLAHHADEREPPLDGAGAPAPALDRDLALRGAPAGAALDRELDLALEVPDRPEDARALDVSLPPSSQPDQLPLPLRDVGPRARAARASRRAAAWAVDAAPLAVLWVGGLAALYARVPLSPGDDAGLVERVLRDGGALALPLLGVVATLGLVHQTLAHALAGATLGKWLVGLRLVSDEGERPPVGRCAARAALSAASVLLLGLGLVPALFTRSGRALHDISAGTRVVEAP